MKSVKKVAIILIVCIIAISVLSSNYKTSAYDMMATINTQAASDGDTNVTNPVTNIAKAVITIARVICAGVAVAMLSILGMKYMSAAPSEKADIKKHAVVYIVGAIVMFACTGILGIIQKFAGSI